MESRGVGSICPVRPGGSCCCGGCLLSVIAVHPSSPHRDTQDQRRKTAVWTAPSVGSHQRNDRGRGGHMAEDIDVLTLLERQHEEIRALFAKVEQATGEERREEFRDLVRLLSVHETAEEE